MSEDRSLTVAVLIWRVALVESVPRPSGSGPYFFPDAVASVRQTRNDQTLASHYTTAACHLNLNPAAFAQALQLFPRFIAAPARNRVSDKRVAVVRRSS